MTNILYIPVGDPNEAVYFDRDDAQVTLASGDRVPIVRYVDADGEEVEPGDVDLYDDIAVICGPLRNGLLLICAITVRSGLPHRDIERDINGDAAKCVPELVH